MDRTCVVETFLIPARLKMMRQGMKVEILPGMRIQEVRMMSLVDQIPDPDLDPGVVRRFLWMFVCR